jgi:LmbE family N-acetylglucosaminyl deacetylase
VKNYFGKVKNIPRKYKLAVYSITIFSIFSFLSFTAYFRYYGTLPDPMTNLIDNLPAPQTQDRILVFSPHPDDETIGAAGYLNTATRKGAQIKVICITDGNRHNLKNQRYQEIKKAGSIIGIKENKIVFYNFPDTKLESYKAGFKEKAKTEIENFKPTIIISPIPEDVHRDHRVTGEVVSDLIKENKDARITWLGFLVHYPRWPRPEGLYPNHNLLPPVNLMNPDRKWTKFELSGTTEDTKEEAVLQYKTQLKQILPRILLQSSVRKNELFVIR